MIVGATSVAGRISSTPDLVISAQKYANQKHAGIDSDSASRRNSPTPPAIQPISNITSPT